MRKLLISAALALLLVGAVTVPSAEARPRYRSRQYYAMANSSYPIPYYRTQPTPYYYNFPNSYGYYQYPQSTWRGWNYYGYGLNR